jgi:hypothetical protein
MFKKTREGAPKPPGPTGNEPTPPYLSEKLIAELQGAVSAARHKRMPRPTDKGENRSTEKDF